MPTPTNNELKMQLDSLDRRLFNEQEGFLPRIELQTRKTNGRVSKLERWQSYVIGFCACITIILLPTIFLVAELLLAHKHV